jgi:hypothetical protein
VASSKKKLPANIERPFPMVSATSAIGRKRRRSTRSMNGSAIAQVNPKTGEQLRRFVRHGGNGRRRGN